MMQNITPNRKKKKKLEQILKIKEKKKTSQYI
jgi:ribosome-binding protein aMBF1 (putative translation factor)